MQGFAKRAASFALAAAVAGCTGTAMKTQNLDPSQYSVVGHGEGEAAGIMLFQVIPIQQNAPFVRAQNGDRVPRRRCPDQPQAQENGFWARVLNGYTTTVSGDVVKLRR